MYDMKTFSSIKIPRVTEFLFILQILLPVLCFGVNNLCSFHWDIFHFFFVFVFFLQVDKQEKKKKKTGRAKRRMQYNRRFVNVVATFGRRKGPNSNS